MTKSKLTKIIISIIAIISLTLGLAAAGFFGNNLYQNYQSDVEFKDINQVTGAYYFDSGKNDSVQTLGTELKAITKNGQNKLSNLRPEVANVDSDGFLKFQDWLNPTTIKEYKQYATDLIPTIKGDSGYPNSGIASWQLLVRTPQKRQLAINTIDSLVISNNLDGIEIDFEPSFLTSPTIDNQPLTQSDYDNLLTFLDDLSTLLTKHNKKLNIAIPAILTNTNTSQMYSYETLLAKKGLMDKLNSITIMAYDLNYGNDYISTAPTELLRDVLNVAKSRVGNYQNKFAFGLNTYGTCKNQETKSVTQLQGQAMKSRKGWDQFTTDNKLVDGGDLTFLSDNEVCSYPNKDTLRARIKLAKSYGFNNYVIWSLSGNNWIN